MEVEAVPGTAVCPSLGKGNRRPGNEAQRLPLCGKDALGARS